MDFRVYLEPTRATAWSTIRAQRRGACATIILSLLLYHRVLLVLIYPPFAFNSLWPHNRRCTLFHLPRHAFTPFTAISLPVSLFLSPPSRYFFPFSAVYSCPVSPLSLVLVVLRFPRFPATRTRFSLLSRFSSSFCLDF